MADNVFVGSFSNNALTFSVKESGQNASFVAEMDTSSFGAATDYNLLANKPLINDVVLEGNKTSSELGLQDNMNRIPDYVIDQIIFG